MEASLYGKKELNRWVSLENKGIGEGVSHPNEKEETMRNFVHFCARRKDSITRANEHQTKMERGDKAPVD